jgi:very-short-patch-repair endonuclease
MIVQRCGGSVHWADLRQLVTRRELNAAVAAGDVLRLGRGRYGLPHLPDAAKAASRTGGVVSHESAVQHHRLPLLIPPSRAHVTVRPNAHPTVPDGVQVHYRRLRRVGATTVLRTVLDCASTLPFAEALAIADAAVRLNQCSRDDLLAAAASWTGLRRRSVVRVARCVDGRSANPFESALRALSIEAGCDGFEPQMRILAGRPFRVDLGHVRLRVVLEADSFEWHGDRAALRRDCRRYDELVRAGWTVLRFAWEDVMFDPAWVMAVIRDVVRRETASRRAQRRG